MWTHIKINVYNISCVCNSDILSCNPVRNCDRERATVKAGKKAKEILSFFTLRCTVPHWLTQFTLTTRVPSWDLVNGTCAIVWTVEGVLCLCYILFGNISSIIVSNVHSVLGDVRVHLNGAIVQWKIRRGPFNSNRFIDVNNVFRRRKAICGRDQVVKIVT